MEGARLEKGAMLAPGTVVPPGRLIPANTLWAGNPCQFVKEFNVAEKWSNYTLCYVNSGLGDSTRNHFHPWGDAYLKKKTTQDDVFPEAHFNDNAWSSYFDPEEQKVMYYF